MSNLTHYLLTHTVSKLIIILGEECSAEKQLKMLAELISCFNNLVILTSSQYYNETIEKKVKDKIIKYSRNVQFTTFGDFFKNGWKSQNVGIFFDPSADYDILKSFKVINPEVLLGYFWSDSFPYFLLWEEYRTISRHIYFECWKSDKVECLNWSYAEDNTELSIIFPVYNVEKYLDKCIQSVTAWKATYVEFLFINDGSKDRSGEIIKSYQKMDSRIKIINKENGGCASARKTGLKFAKGKYIGFVDPDDFVDETMFQKLLERAILGAYEICFCGYKTYFENTKQIRNVTEDPLLPYCNGVTDSKLIKDLTIYSSIAIWRRIFRRDFLMNNDITFQTQFRRFDDLPFKFETFSLAKSVVAVPEYLYYYRLEREGQDVSCTDKRLFIHFDIFIYLDKFVEKMDDSSLVDYLQVCKLQSHEFAINQLDRVYLKSYMENAKKDLLQNCSVLRMLYLIKKYSTNKDLILFLEILLKSAHLFRVMKCIEVAKTTIQNEKRQKLLDKLKKLYK